jgi:hypothetical protein
MFDRLSPVQPVQGSDVIARATGALALAGLAVIHVVDLPGTLGPTPLVGIGYVGLIAAAVLAGGAMIMRSHWMTWAVGGSVALAAMVGYVLTRSLSGGFLGDHGDVGNWQCPLGLAALSVETLIILLAVLGSWQARRLAPHPARALAQSASLALEPGPISPSPARLVSEPNLTTKKISS